MIKKINSILICHPRKFLSGVQSRVSGFPIKTFGNDNSFRFRNDTRGQTALILILLAAAALIFLAITLNWGRIAQTKVLLSIAADQSAALLASDAASYGEMQKQTYLKDQNKLSFSTDIFSALIMVVIAIIALPFTFGSSWVLILLAVASVVMSIANLALQVMVVAPMITSLWNKSQSNQPVPQQFYEGAIQTALEGSVQDQVKITDYLDWNANGQFGLNGSGSPNDTVSRFALFYSDRLKMINGASPTPIPQVQNFYNQLQDLMNGTDNFGGNPTNFKLNDPCTNSDPTQTATYNPYCDPCCQPLTIDGNAARPSTCDQSATPSNCLINNPYGAPYYYLYDPTFQNYSNTDNPSFLDQFGRDQPFIPLGSQFPLTTMTPDVMTPTGTTPALEFPNGIFPFFWLTDAYSLEVDNINPATLSSSQYHWCTTTVAPAVTTPTGFMDLAQLTLPYTCSGLDCCVNNLADSVTASGPSSSGNIKIDVVGSPSFGSNPGLDPSFGEGGSGTWLAGDNQMCLTTWPYNGSSATGPVDGTCEISGSGSSTPTSSETVDNVDDTMHALSDFVNFANTFLSSDVGTLSSTFSTWYPQAAGWVAPCDDGSACNAGQCSDGTSCPAGRLLPLPANLNTWSGVITNWLNNTYASSSAWCVPTEAALLSASNGSIDEDTYINITSGTGTWGDLPHVTACLNYNADPYSSASGPIYKYTQCLNQLNSFVGACFNLSTISQCQPSVLGRSLTGQSAPAFTGQTITCSSSIQCQHCDTCCNSCCPCGDCSKCSSVTDCAQCGSYTCNCSTYTNSVSNTYPPASTCVNGDANGCVSATCASAPVASCNSGDSAISSPTINNSVNSSPDSCDSSQAGSYAKWVSDSLTLATDEAPKFALRSSFLNDVYTRAQTMQTILGPAAVALNNFLTGPNSPSEQLTWAFNHQTTADLPNSVIYGWVDPAPTGGSGGCWDPSKQNRVGCAHIVKVTAYSPGRTTGSPLPSPNPPAGGSGLPWIQTKTLGFLGTTRTYTLMNRDGYAWVGIRRWDEDHNPVLFPNGQTLWQSVFHTPGGTTYTGQGLPPDCISVPLAGNTIGVGLLDATLTGLQTAGILQPDLKSLGDAFMLNGSIDPNTATGACLAAVNDLFTRANPPESHACAEYLGSLNASPTHATGTGCDPQGSCNGDSDYSVKFVDDSQCNSPSD